MIDKRKHKIKRFNDAFNLGDLERHAQVENELVETKSTLAKLQVTE